MFLKLQIIPARDFVKTTSEGELDLEKSKKRLAEIASVISPLGLTDYETLIDTREANPKMSATDIWQLAAEFAEYRIAFRNKIAVLVPQNGFNQAKFFGLCAQNRGFEVDTFTNFEDAIKWLHEYSGGDEHKITRRKSQKPNDELDRQGG